MEIHERELAKTATVKVEIRMVYSPRSQKLPSGATIPDGFYKTIWIGTKKELYYFPNIVPTQSDYTKYLLK